MITTTAFAVESTSAGMELVGRARSLFVTRDANGVARPWLANANVAAFAVDEDSFTATPAGNRNRADVPRARLPKVANGTMRLSAGAMQVDVTPRGFAAAPIEWSEHVAAYADVQPGVHAFRVVAGDGVEDYFQVESPREELSFTYDVRVANVAGLRLVANTLEFLETDGNPRLRATQPELLDARGVMRAGSLSVSGCAYDTSPHGPWGRPVTAPGATTCTVTVKFDGRGLAYPVLIDPAWVGTANSKQTHAYHKLLPLPAGPDSGKILLVGGTGSGVSVTELFNPATKTWAAAGNVPSDTTWGMGSNAVVLATGVVVLTGGFPTSGTTTTAQASVAVRTPATGAWAMGAAMSGGRAWHSMVATKVDGKDVALVMGGQPSSSLSSTNQPLKSAEYYLPGATPGTDDNWFGAGSMSVTRTKGKAVALGDGRVLVAGGETYSTSTTVLDAADIFNPTTKTWSAAPPMKSKRTQLELVALAGSGAGAIAIGGNPQYYATSSPPMHDTLEYFDGSSWTLLTAKLSVPRWQLAAARMDDGRILITGGQSYNATSFTSYVTDVADIFIPGSNPLTGTVNGAGLLATTRQFHAMANLPGTGVLVAGGLTTNSTGSETSSSELFNTAIGGACGTGCTGGLTCVDGVCCTTSSCPSGQTCNAPGREGVCTKPKGVTCTSNAECATGYCVTGVCCENACAGGCKACNNPGKAGTCELAAAGTDPGGFCTGTSDAICGRKCDGTGKCSTAYAPAGTPCGASASDAGTGSFCTTYACSSFGSCSSTTNNCGLTCTTSVTCSEATKTCTATAAGIKAGFCVIDGACFAYGDINPKDSCQVCDPPTSKTSWSTAVSCMDGSVDTGVEEDTGVEDTGGTGDDTGAVDTGMEIEDTGSPVADTGEQPDTAPALGSDLPEASTCGCRTPGNDNNSVPGVLAAVGLALAVAARRRR